MRPGSAKCLSKPRNVAEVRKNEKSCTFTYFSPYFSIVSTAIHATISCYSCLPFLLRDNLCTWRRNNVGISLMLISPKSMWSSIEQHLPLHVGEALCTSFPLLLRAAASLLGDESGQSPRRWAASRPGGVRGQMGSCSRISEVPHKAGGQHNGPGNSWSLASGWQQKCEGESVKVSAQAEGSWTMTGKPQGSLLTQHLCHDWGSEGAWNRASSWAARWSQVLRQGAGGHGRRKRWRACSGASAPHVSSCEKALQRWPWRGKSFYFD